MQRRFYYRFIQRTLVFRDYSSKLQSTKLGLCTCLDNTIFMMSVAIWKIWIKYFDKKPKAANNNEFVLSRSVFFFGFHQIGFALINIIIILFFIIFLMKLYFVKDKLSFYLMLPYLLWSSYALILNFSIFLLN